MDALDFDDKHYDRKKSDLNARLEKAYDKIEELEEQLYAAKAKKSAIEAEQVTAENIYRVLRNFNDLYKVMDDEERRKLMEALIAEVQIYEDKKESGQWLKSIKFKLPIVEESFDISLDKSNSVKTVCLLSKGDVKSQKLRVEFSLEDMDTDGFKKGATYNAIRDWIKEKYGYRVTNLNIAQVKQKHGIIERENYNKPKSPDSKQPGCPEEKAKAIEAAMRHFQMI